MEGCIGSIISTFSSCIKDLVMKHVKYVLNVGENVEALHRNMQILEARRDDVEEKINLAKRASKKPTNEVQEWKKRVDTILIDARAIISDYDNIGCSVDCYINHSVGKRAEEEQVKVNAELEYEKNDLKVVVVEAQTPSVQEMPTTSTMPHGQLELKLEEALQFLKEDDVHGMLGIWGMGGVGKTTLLEHINNALAKDPSSFGFHFVIFLVASKQCTATKIQELLAQKLGLPSAGDLSANIFNCLINKNFVLLLDDLWDPLDLKQVGIPHPRGFVGGYKHKIVLTSRFRQVCRNMDARRTIRVECLNRKAARFLFWETVGEETINCNPLIPDLAMKIVDECDGLPLALKTIGRAMVGTQAVEVWEDAIDLLLKSKLSKIKGMDDPLPLLKTSYDFLKDPREKECFLMCALWPEDFQIDKEELIECWMGHGLLDEFDTIREAHNRGHAIIDSLQKACLLERVENAEDNYLRNTSVKMHDVIRDMALWIARDCGVNEKKWMVHAGLDLMEAPSKQREWNEAHKVSLMHNNIQTLPSNIGNCPSLTNLLLQSNIIGYGRKPLNVRCFEALKYLDMSHTSLDNFPKQICTLEKLEYLNLSSNSGIRSLPEELNALVELKYLLLRDCPICEVPKGIFSKLVKLLVLDVYQVLATYEINPSTIIEGLHCLEGQLKALGINATKQSDLDNLARLSGIPVTTLSINRLAFIPSLSKMIGSKHIGSNLKNLIISECIGSPQDLVVDYSCRLVNLEMLFLATLSGLNKIIWKGVRPRDVLSRLRCLIFFMCHILKHASWTVNLPCLEFLDLASCDNMKIVVSELGEGEEERFLEKEKLAAFPSLRVLRLSTLPMLDSICDFDVTFPCLEVLYVDECPQLKKLPFSSTTSCSRLQKIEGRKEWWESLDMEDNIRIYLPFFVKVES